MGDEMMRDGKWTAPILVSDEWLAEQKRREAYWGRLLEQDTQRVIAMLDAQLDPAHREVQYRYATTGTAGTGAPEGSSSSTAP